MRIKFNHSFIQPLTHHERHATDVVELVFASLAWCSCVFRQLVN